MKLNDEEIKILEQGKSEGYKWIARDGDNELCLYERKPKWDNSGIYWYDVEDTEWTYADNEYFAFISNNEKGIYNIEELLTNKGD